MLIPVPGYNHLKIHVREPHQDAPEEPEPLATPTTLPARLRAHVIVLLEVLCGQRPPRQLSPLAYGPGVTAQARTRAPQAVRLCSLHLRERHHDAPEFYGTCEIAGERYGFTGWLAQGKIAEFRVLR
ncbi:hypothetical protein [Corynebacterium oculi]|uniref:Uncharacterized protein n=1 Tax=Corynebacterium oculi TaxID=1544416 RepID=A0A0N8VZK2_9CORY|nr:hypothetical protein [Corynebacterium oculi]KQB84130.1 hypothetical protein Cocul_00927 [Corynebacterium oculi]